MNVLDALRELFSAYPFAGKDLVWVVDELLRVVQHTHSVHFEYTRDDAGRPRGLIARSVASACEDYLLPVSRLGVFRSMLARLSVMASDETGTEFEPYGGTYTLYRSSRDGPVRLDIEFTNTTASQHLSITRTRVAKPQNGPSVNGSPAPPVTESAGA